MISRRSEAEYPPHDHAVCQQGPGRGRERAATRHASQASPSPSTTAWCSRPPSASPLKTNAPCTNTPWHPVTTCWAVDIERFDTRNKDYRTWQSSRFSVVIPESKLVDAHLIIQDSSDMGKDFPDDQDGEYDLRVAAPCASRQMSDFAARAGLLTALFAWGVPALAQAQEAPSAAAPSAQVSAVDAAVKPTAVDSSDTRGASMRAIRPRSTSRSSPPAYR